MRLWGKKKQPESTLTLNKHFYLSILAGPGILPPLLQIINPQGSNGAIKGFGIPLDKSASKDILNEPLRESAYGLTTFDKTNILRLDVFDIINVPSFTLNDEMLNLLSNQGTASEVIRRAKAAKWLINISFQGFGNAHDAVVFLLDVAERISVLTDAAIADPLAESYRHPSELRIVNKMDPRFDYREVGSITAVKRVDGWWLSTRGMAKFNLPELEMFGLRDNQREVGAKMLISAAQQALIGIPMHPGETAFAVSSPLYIVAGTKQREQWGDRPTLEFQDPNSSGAERGVDAWENQKD